MAMSPKNASVNKKHVAHLTKVRRQSQIIKYITIGIFVLVGVVILVGLANTAGFPPYRNVASVNGEKLTADNFKIMVKLTRSNLIRQYTQTLDFAQMLGMDPTTDPTFSDQLQQIISQLDASNKVTLGQQVLDTMVENALYEQEAAKRGLTVSDEELDKYIKENQFGYYANGTPTPAPSATPFILPTLNPTQLALVTITPIPSATPSQTPTEPPTATPNTTPAPTQTATSAPLPTSTPYTLEGFQQIYSEIEQQYISDFGMDDSFFRDYFFVLPLLKQKVQDSITADLKPEEDQVWARHILVATEDEANKVYARLQAGEDFAAVAEELSLDTGSGSLGGDLGWFGRGKMVQEFEDAAFSQPVGEIGKPVQSQYGYHIIQVLGHEVRPLTDSEFSQLKQQAVSDWLTQAKAEAKVTTYDFWKNIVPTEPSLGQ